MAQTDEVFDFASISPGHGVGLHLPGAVRGVCLPEGPVVIARAVDQVRRRPAVRSGRSRRSAPGASVYRSAPRCSCTTGESGTQTRSLPIDATSRCSSRELPRVSRPDHAGTSPREGELFGHHEHVATLIRGSTTARKNIRRRERVIAESDRARPRHRRGVILSRFDVQSRSKFDEPPACRRRLRGALHLGSSPAARTRRASRSASARYHPHHDRLVVRSGIRNSPGDLHSRA